MRECRIWPATFWALSCVGCPQTGSANTPSPRAWQRLLSSASVSAVFVTGRRTGGRRARLVSQPTRSLHQQLEVKTQRLAQLAAALQDARRAAYRQAAPFRGQPQKCAGAPKRKLLRIDREALSETRNAACIGAASR
jgi:hypothetical protein